MAGTSHSPVRQQLAAKQVTCQRTCGKAAKGAAGAPQAASVPLYAAVCLLGEPEWFMFLANGLWQYSGSIPGGISLNNTSYWLFQCAVLIHWAFSYPELEVKWIKMSTFLGFDLYLYPYVWSTPPPSSGCLVYRGSHTAQGWALWRITWLSANGEMQHAGQMLQLTIQFQKKTAYHYSIFIGGLLYFPLVLWTIFLFWGLKISKSVAMSLFKQMIDT